MLVYGLTGGIGSGKSTIAEWFRKAGVPTFDADQIGRSLLEGNAPIAAEIARRLPTCIRPDGTIDRRGLGSIVFGDRNERRWLEDLLHPAILKEFQDRIERLPGPSSRFCILEGAVLLESETDFDLAGMIVVTAPLATRLQRLRERDGLKDEEIEARMKAQLPESEKAKKASHLIDNSGPPEWAERQVREVVDQLNMEIGGCR